MGSIDQRELATMKTQLDVLQQSLARFSAPRAADAEPSHIYPHLTIDPVREDVQKPLPPVPACAPVPPPECAAEVVRAPVLAQANGTPEGVVDDVQEIVKQIAEVIKRMFAAFSAFADATGIPHEQSDAAVAPVVGAKPSYSRKLPTAVVVAPMLVAPAPAQQLKRKSVPVTDAETHVVDADVHPQPIDPAKASELRETAIVRLDSAIACVAGASPADLVIMTNDELFCINRFRQMVAERQGKLTKNFMQKLEKLCRKS
jgi:hypothetical protein